MSSLDPYRLQHEELLARFTDLQAVLDAEDLPRRATEALARLNQVSTRLAAHLAMEDAFLYPAFIHGPDPRLAELARAFKAEMGDLLARFQAYHGRWTTPAQLTADPDRFLGETTALLADLRRRIQREDAELYPAAEAAGLPRG